MTGIVWIRRSFRAFDNRALVEAAGENEEVIPVHVIDHDYLEKQTLGYPRVKFWHDSVEGLSNSLEERNSSLILRSGSPIKQLSKVAEETDADKLYFNRCYSPYPRDLEARVEEKLDISTESFKDLVISEKKEILTNKGTPYKVFTYYMKKWFKRDKRKPEEPGEFRTPFLESESLPTPEELGFEKPEGMEIWEGGREIGLKRLKQFMKDIPHYDNLRDIPARDGTSKLSPYIRFGNISIREAFWKAEERKEELKDTGGIKTWQEELCWRDFYFQVLWNWPETVDQAFIEKYRGLDWRDDKGAMENWKKFKKGRTGFPFVDAGIRQLRRHGWMHNRLRMLAASFACNDLKIDWRKLHEFFKKWFVDAEVSAMVGGIQWAYSIGTDAQPYFRVFNPWTHGEDHDPEGEFIRRFVPELEDVPDQFIHRPYKMSEDVQESSDCIIGEDYPEPIVNHDEERKSAIEMFEKST
ncbi:MAG: deoxyribodipyrimidine photo-lyase [Candidatus Nanohaloarchaea archaeon]|nr:deoxyribodipyrimidine photo-lyase [Candidatus Nanohaloarchaea archaeon]